MGNFNPLVDVFRSVCSFLCAGNSLQSGRLSCNSVVISHPIEKRQVSEVFFKIHLKNKRETLETSNKSGKLFVLVGIFGWRTFQSLLCQGFDFGIQYARCR